MASSATSRSFHCGGVAKCRCWPWCLAESTRTPRFAYDEYGEERKTLEGRAMKERLFLRTIGGGPCPSAYNWKANAINDTSKQH